MNDMQWATLVTVKGQPYSTNSFGSDLADYQFTGRERRTAIRLANKGWLKSTDIKNRYFKITEEGLNALEEDKYHCVWRKHPRGGIWKVWIKNIQVKVFEMPKIGGGYYYMADIPEIGWHTTKHCGSLRQAKDTALIALRRYCEQTVEIIKEVEK